MPKTILRSKTLATRKGLAAEQVDAMSLSIQERFLALPEFQTARSIALYSPIHNEVETVLVARQALDLGKRVCFPAAVGEHLSFREVRDLSELHPGRFGILEPQGASLDPTFFDLIVVPGICFDSYGRRIGYGKGFYDKALHRMEGAGRLVAFCYGFQLLSEILGEPHDVVMDLIITEERVVRVHNNIGGTQL
ncbi:5-formyltetrahydrofolate cyclo-ligase [Geomesophilobacter sediminis]|uniref:5-formyltetrahydrofolate cyclo-ligase n=1 Tax=Geomesophilobacter sediminis TaxID=2798584 RepID=A0A8J7LZ35_9BACT|nr:5-formyltetrahydrofolate cyclo-ligase [Geomesophilobacter sediminis]MBJ6725821.1 5-formyltetrahydrofolate cyclo-ligase [Geomesophilobacter sediminis]